jgi:hypothetical protein
MKLSFCFAFSKLLCEQQRRMQQKDEEQENAHTYTFCSFSCLFAWGLLASTGRLSFSLLCEDSCSTMENKMCWNGYEEARSQ